MNCITKNLRQPTSLRLLFTALCALGLLARTSLGAVLEGPIVNPANGHSYFLLTANTWTASEAEAVALGGHLATVNDAAENAWIAATFPAPYYYLWVGLNDVAVEGQFVWSSGQPVTYLNWYVAQPDNYDGGESYVFLYNFDSGFWQWNDAKDVSLCGSFPIYGVAEVEPAHATNLPPSLTAQPQARTNFASTTVAFGLAAKGSAPLRYQWHFNEGALSGATNATLVLSSVTTDQAGSYWVVVTNAYGSVTSSIATLSVILPAPQPVRVGVQKSGSQVIVSWPPGLGLVQPQKASSLAAGAFQDFGPATTASNLLDTQVTSEAFYRLLFLAPIITAQPSGQTVGTGSQVTLSVSATGTAPKSYQWRKDGVDLNGQTASTLWLPGAALLDGGHYTVVLANRAGSVTSSVAALTVTNAQIPVPGIYMGRFAGETDNAGFAVLVNSSLRAVMLGYAPDTWGLYASMGVSKDGSFSAPTTQDGTAAGRFNQGVVSGTYTNWLGWSADFSGQRKSDTGPHQADAGYYTGSFDGYYVGDCYAIVAADGTTFLSAWSLGNSDAGYGTISEANIFSAMTVAEAFYVTGAVDPARHQITGTYNDINGWSEGTFTLTRTMAP